MAPPPAALALFALAFVLILSGAVLCGMANSKGRDIATDLLTLLQASRSRYEVSQVASATACDGVDPGCGTCNPIDLASTVPTFAYFHFYNITNGADVTAGTASPALAEVGPYTCVSAPPYSEASITRTSSTSADDSSADTFTYTETLNCAAVIGGTDLVTLYDQTDGIVEKSASAWVSLLQSAILSGADTVGTGNGNSSIPNNYMRRTSDDVPVLPMWPHAYLPDDDFKLASSIDADSTLQWYVSSIGYVVSFTWEYPLYMKDPMFDRWLYARFVGYLPAAPIDLSSRSSSLFDKAYSYHKCVETSGTFADVSNYPVCAEGVNEDLSPEAFFIDVDLFMGIPSVIPAEAPAQAGIGGWQAWTKGEFASLPDQNCTAQYGDAGVSPWMWGFGYFLGAGIIYPSHTSDTSAYPTADAKFDHDYPLDWGVLEIRNKKLTSGYNPYNFWGGGSQGKWLAEFGITRNGAILPAFAFAMMPKMIPMMSPASMGATWPNYVMGGLADKNQLSMSKDVSPYGFPERSSLQYLTGVGVYSTMHHYSHGWYTLYLYAGIYSILFAICPVLLLGAYRFKADAATA